MESFFVAVFFVSVFLICHGLVRRLLVDRLLLSDPFVALLFGLLIGPCCFDALRTRYALSKAVLLYAAKAVLCLQTMACAVSLPSRFVTHRLPSLCVLVIGVGSLSFAFTACLAYAFSRYAAPPSLAIAAALTPTDPVLCSSLLAAWGRVLRPGVCHLLSAESGINDAFGLLLLLLPLHAASNSYTALAGAVLWKAGGGALAGAIAGSVARILLVAASTRRTASRDATLAFTVALTSALLGLCEAVGFSELACVFTAACMMRSAVSAESARLQTLVDGTCTKALFVLLGSRIDLRALTPRLAAFSFITIIVRRPAIVLALYKVIPGIQSAREALAVGWLGPIGIGAIYYSLYYDSIAGTTTHTSVNIIVMLSVFVHAVVMIAIHLQTFINESGIRTVLEYTKKTAKRLLHY